MPATNSRDSSARLMVCARRSCRGHADRVVALLALTAAVLALMLPGRPALATEASPEALAQTRTVVDHAIGILRDSHLSLAEERRRLRELAETHFDFADMSRSSLGYHWRELSEEQRREFVPVFSAFVEDAYLSRIQRYSGQEIEFVDQKSDEPDYASVDTRIVGKSDSATEMTFRLKHEGREWKIYDVVVASISITANYRNQFSRVINNQGFDKLMSDLRAKQSQLAALGRR